ncbi:restriction endonuclease subunit S [Staphylococcus epidermidis]|uniref:restriction endonuclease subunit S n=1 Tax=Staphylococcus epidermidis TaxID=1282 RepID=UPI0020967314|nr:restriction endonuclease subunit S [Staphylococcus epidermidis]MCG1064164.1 restriction endonuclease subunit S [Staphylococcus epidermidis]MCG1149515.1 restriction endonuclease subunit S [Staphylococcus epidermidis]MCG1151942.1 restriction endonuclease subunit S [Staphylococcus epidermidis]MCG1627073.1 restriction endonuclease subunit S [Staphylococcus epidermidis]MCG1764780.1 restriction endonuclease subunit S [Staphylococcus epidermidis]
MMKLSDREWKEFDLEDDIFQLSSSINSTDYSKLNKIGENIHPFVTRTQNNNGLTSFIPSQDKPLNTSNVITIGLDTQTVFYQPKAFYTGQNVQIFRCNKFNKYIALFIKPLLIKQLENLNWGGNGATLGRLRKKKILLPINSNDQPDYDFMEQYIKEKYFKLKSQIKEKQKHEITDWRELDEVEWEVFEMENIFEFKQGKSKGLNHLKIGGTIPYLGAKYNNNGVLAFVDSTNNLISKGNCISFIRNGEGSMGYSIYKKEDHIATSDITNGYNNHLNKYNGQFISTMSNLVRGKYNFGYKRSLTRLKKEQIKLPSINNQPDYDFMEQYMKRKENKILDRL